MDTRPGSIRPPPRVHGRGRRSVRRLVFLLISLLLATTGLPAAVSATVPSNDAFEAATEISATPFHDGVDIADATSEPGEPNGGYTPLAVRSGTATRRRAAAASRRRPSA